MIRHSTPFIHYEWENFLSQEVFDYHDKNFPSEEQFRNTNNYNEVTKNLVLELEIDKYFNEHPDFDQPELIPLYNRILESIPEIKNEVFMVDVSHDSFYVNFHHDKPGSDLDIHNDLKNYRWLMTCQIYLDNSDQGVWLLGKHGNKIKQVKNKKNLCYIIPADCYTWHSVDPIKKDKRSILFRFGKFRHETVAYPNLQSKTAYLIDNTVHHCDEHYAKLGLRMGNLTEAWLVLNKNASNIYHTKYRDEEHKKKMLNRLNNPIPGKDPEYDRVEIVPAGFFDRQFYITEENWQNVGSTIFGGDVIIPEIAKAEKYLQKYNPYLYQDIK